MDRRKSRKSEFRVAGATQDATSAERCDLTQDPSSMDFQWEN